MATRVWFEPLQWPVVSRVIAMWTQETNTVARQLQETGDMHTEIWLCGVVARSRHGSVPACMHTEIWLCGVVALVAMALWRGDSLGHDHLTSPSGPEAWSRARQAWSRARATLQGEGIA